MHFPSGSGVIRHLDAVNVLQLLSCSCQGFCVGHVGYSMLCLHLLPMI